MGKLAEAAAVRGAGYDVPADLANIELRIELHMRGAYENILEVGRCLVEAKESGLVGHGEWEAWVRRNTQMSERQAQRLMRAARNVRPGSAMERLPISKIQAILALPDFEREPMAVRAAEGDMSLREVRAAVRESHRGTEGVTIFHTEAQRRGEETTEKISPAAAWGENGAPGASRLTEDGAPGASRPTGDGAAGLEIERLKAELSRALAMRGMADMMRAVNERMGELERQVRLLTKVTPMQAGAINAAIRARASELCAEYGIEGGETAAGSAIRRDVRLTQGINNIRELPRCEYAAVMRQVGMWDDRKVMSKIG